MPLIRDRLAVLSSGGTSASCSSGPMGAFWAHHSLWDIVELVLSWFKSLSSTFQIRHSLPPAVVKIDFQGSQLVPQPLEAEAIWADIVSGNCQPSRKLLSPLS